MVTINFDKIIGNIKLMNAVNNGPTQLTMSTQLRSNFLDYKKARIPYARNHDAAFCSTYGGEHTVDVHAIFPNFDADENDENNYDFFYTDSYIKNILDAGTETYYRLGSKIEHGPKKYGTLKPKDPLKWAKICEHIIAHYNKGWANGFYYNIQYWEIWNEPDLRYKEVPEKRPNWSGSKEEFFDFFIIVAKYLKDKFPDVKIGGPAIACSLEWADEFLSVMSNEKVELDFFSWHCYTYNVEWFLEEVYLFRDMLDKYGYKDTESHCNEWNYVESWTDRYVETIEDINNERGASYVTSIMNACQNAPIDMLMYYDARVSTIFNGMFNLYTLRPQKGYYPFYCWSFLRDLGNSVAVESDDKRISATAAIKDGKAGILLSYYDFNKEVEKTEEVNINLNGLKINSGDIYLTDKNHQFEKVSSTTNNKITLTLKPNSVVFIALNGLEV